MECITSALPSGYTPDKQQMKIQEMQWSLDSRHPPEKKKCIKKMFVHVSEPKGCWDVLWTPSLIFFPCWFQNCQHEEGDIRVYSIAVWNLFQAVFRYFNLMCGIAVSSSPTVCSFSTFWLVVFCKRRSFKIFWYWLFAFSCLIKVNTTCNKNTVRF